MHRSYEKGLFIGATSMFLGMSMGHLISDPDIQIYLSTYFKAKAEHNELTTQDVCKEITDFTKRLAAFNKNPASEFVMDIQQCMGALKPAP